jgi:branched-chain amino acid transport system substrate-binding protein
MMVGLLAAGALVLAACGSDDNSSDTTAAAATTAASATTAAPATTTGATTAAPATTEASKAPVAADPNKPPVLVGFHNLEGGSISLPEVREAFEAGVKYVNTELGGINGHTMKIDSCKVDISPETSINCANKFVDDNVALSVTGSDFTFDAALPVLKEAGIVDVTPFAAGPLANTSQGDSYSLTFSNEEGFAAGLVLLQSLGAKSVAQLHADIPQMQSAMTDTVQPTADKLGLKLQPYFYTSGQTDWTTFAATVLTDKPDAVNLFATDADCLAAIPALRNAGFKGVIVAGVCTLVASQLDPSLLDNVYVGATYYNPDMVNVPAAVQPDVDTFKRFVDWGSLKTPGSALQGFYMAVMAADMLRQVPGDAVTAESVKANIGKAKGATFMRGGKYDCAKPTWPGTTACSTGWIYSSINKDRKFEVLPNQPIDVSAVAPAG